MTRHDRTASARRTAAPPRRGRPAAGIAVVTVLVLATVVALVIGAGGDDTRTAVAYDRETQVLETDDVRKGRDVGSTGVYDPVVDGRALTFSPAGPRTFRDRRRTAAGVSRASPSTARWRAAGSPPFRTRTPSGSPGRRSKPDTALVEQ